jgi:hypothetical protein
MRPESDHQRGLSEAARAGQAGESVNHPAHYGGDTVYEAIKIIEAVDFPQKLAFHLGNALKYVLRAGKKDPNKTVEDLKKAVWYLNRAISVLERQESANKAGQEGG